MKNIWMHLVFLIYRPGFTLFDRITRSMLWIPQGNFRYENMTEIFKVFQPWNTLNVYSRKNTAFAFKGLEKISVPF